ncbi:MAG TPA: cytochrome c biogenesis protein CcsA [Patescibacteria group bacterium]|nr:cytochrome c biogenesis protein CcsA [Patescibacteria group bacterium]
MKKIIVLAMLACWLAGHEARAAAPFPLEPFRRLAVLEQGRKKPLDTYARNLLKQFSGRSTLNGMDACAWLARVLFVPDETLEDKLFLINQPDVLAALGMEGDGRGRFSYAQLRPGLARLHELAFRYTEQDEASGGRVENEIIRLFYNVSAFNSLLHAFHFARPGETASGDPRRAPPLPALLPLAGSPDEQWLGPAQAFARGSSLPAAMQREISLLAQAAQAYVQADGSDFKCALDSFSRSVRNRLPPGAITPGKLSLEVFYNRLDPFFKAELIYVLALLLLIFSLALSRTHLDRWGWLCLLLGFLFHTFGLAARMLIMNRPPVTNLYETFIFVAWAGAAMGLLMAWWQKQPLGILTGAISGLIFLVIAGRYSLDGDTMGMLAAVLDSNLWLATHVVTISLGYAGCVVAGIIGHVVLVQELLDPRSPAAAGTARSMYAALAFGLTLTSIGTVMGGIWADQSWGRFWGWDPKENGALLIIIWCAILFHARLAGWIGQLGMAAGSIVAIITVVMAWFGVNLLGVGLHAYGFTSGAARGLLAFVVAELLFLTVALSWAKKKSQAGAADTGGK